MSNPFPHSYPFPQSADELPALQHSIETLLNRIPDVWEEFDFDQLSSMNQRGLRLLVFAGLVEFRGRLRIVVMNRQSSTIVEVSMTGVAGFEQAISPVLETIWARYFDACEEWKMERSTYRGMLRSEPVGHPHWRLTDQGEIAKRDLAGSVDDRSAVFNFVLKQGFFTKSKFFRGYGTALQMEADDGMPITPRTVNVANGKELANIFSDAFRQTISEMQQAMFSAKPADQPLSVAEQCVLKALVEREPQTKDELTRSAFGNHEATGQITTVLAKLTEKNAIKSGGRGRGSQGYTITDEGRKMLQRQ